MSPSPSSIVVVGSINRDMVVNAPRLPLPGETILGDAYTQHNGGKGANQAVALARLGQNVTMVGSVGNDPDGDALVAALDHEDISTDFITRSTRHTGIALITVDAHGENSIVGVPGANGDLGGEAIAAASHAIATADIVLAQLEVPIASVSQAFAHAEGVVVLNPAPASMLHPELLASVDYLIPNRTELVTLTGRDEIDGVDGILAAVAGLDFAGTLIVTLGGDGAIAIRDGAIIAMAMPPQVDVVDTVGAGDSFCAGLCDALARELPLQKALEWATACGALATTKMGAQPSMPTAADVRVLITAET